MARSPLFDLYDPYDLLTQQAQLGMLPEDDEEMDVFGAIPVRRKPRISDLMPEEQQSSMLGRLAELGSSGLSAVGWLLDTPGAMLRGTLSEGPMKGLSALWETSDDRVTGRELLRQYGMIGEEDTWGNFGGSLVAEIALDPLTWVNPLAILGRGALTQSGKALKGAGLLRYAPEQAWQGYVADAAAQARGAADRQAQRGARSYLRELTPEQALAEIADPAERAAATARWRQQAARYGVDPDDLTQSAARLMDVRIPGTNIGFSTDVFGERFGNRLAEGLDWAGEQSKRNPVTGPVVNALNAGFRSRLGETLDPDVQWDARLARMDYDRAEEARRFLRTQTEREAMGADAGAVADAIRAAGGTAPVVPEGLRRFERTPLQRAFVDYAESPQLQGPTLSGVPLGKTSGDDVADWVLENVPEFRNVRDLYVDSVQQARANAIDAGLPDRSWTGESGTEFFPRQLKWWERILDPVRPNARNRRERPWGRSQVLLDTADNFGRGRNPGTDIPGGVRTFRMLTGNAAIDPATGRPLLDSADLQRRLIAADQIPARQILDDAFDTIGVDRPFQEEVRRIQSSPQYIALANDPARQQALLAPAIAEREARQDYLVNLLRGSDLQFAQNNTGIFDTPGWTNLMRYEQGQNRILANAGRMVPRLADAVQTVGPRGLADGMVPLADAARTLGFDPENFGQMWLGRYGQDIANQAVPQRLVDSLKTVVRSTQAGDVERQLLNAYDQYLNFWKVGALASPAFHTRNTYSGMLNAATMGAFNPLDWWAALRASMGNTNALARRLRNAPGFQGLTDAERVARFQDLTGANRIGGGTIFDDVSGFPEQSIRGPWLGAGNEGSPLRGFYTPGRSWTDALNDFFTVRGVGITRNPAARNRNPFLMVNDALGSTVEDALRGGTFLNQLRKGVDPGEAADLVRLSQVDYSPQAFTSFERNVLKRILPFYSFQKGILPSIADNLLYRPGGLMGQSIRGVNRSTQPTEDNFVPEYLRQSAAIPLPEELGGGNPELQRYLTNIDLPWESTFQLFTPGVGATLPSRISDTIQKTASNLLGMATPAIKWPVELATNRQLYTGRDLTDLYSVLERDMGSIGRPLEQAAVNLLPFGSRGLGIYRQLTDDRLDPADRYAKAAFNLLAGVKATDIDQDRAKRQAARDMLNSILETTPGVRTYENITVPPEVLETMAPEQRDMYLLYKIIQSEAAKRARDKKKQETALDPLQMLGVVNQF